MKLPALILCLSFALAVPARAGSLYITSGDTVVSFDVSLGTASAIAASRQTVLSGTASLQNAQGIVFDSSANLYVASLGGLGSDGWVTKFNPDGSFHSMITEAMKSPSALAVTSSNSLWVLNIGPQNPIVQYTPTGTAWGAITNLPNNPASLAVNSADALYVGFQNDSGDRIKIFNGVSQVGGIGAPANWVGGWPSTPPARSTPPTPWRTRCTCSIPRTNTRRRSVTEARSIPLRRWRSIRPGIST